MYAHHKTIRVYPVLAWFLALPQHVTHQGSACPVHVKFVSPPYVPLILLQQDEKHDLWRKDGKSRAHSKQISRKDSSFCALAPIHGLCVAIYRLPAKSLIVNMATEVLAIIKPMRAWFRGSSSTHADCKLLFDTDDTTILRDERHERIIKIIKRKDVRKAFEREVRALRELAPKLAFVPALHTSKWSPGESKIVMEDRGLDLIELINVDMFTVDLWKRACEEVLAGIRALHALNISHNDIKPENIAYSPRTRAFSIIDFGFVNTCTCASAYPGYKFFGTIPYVCPFYGSAQVRARHRALFDPETGDFRMHADMYSYAMAMLILVGVPYEDAGEDAGCHVDLAPLYNTAPDLSWVREPGFVLDTPMYKALRALSGVVLAYCAPGARSLTWIKKRCTFEVGSTRPPAPVEYDTLYEIMKQMNVQ